MTAQQQKVINEIIEKFDFKKVHKTMEFLNWKWICSDLRVKVPDIDEMIKTARYLLTNVANNSQEESFCSTGGFEANKHDNYYFSLKFIITDWDNFDDSEIEDETKELKYLFESNQKKYNICLKGLEV